MGAIGNAIGGVVNGLGLGGGGGGGLGGKLGGGMGGLGGKAGRIPGMLGSAGGGFMNGMMGGFPIRGMGPMPFPPGFPNPWEMFPGMFGQPQQGQQAPGPQQASPAPQGIMPALGAAPRGQGSSSGGPGGGLGTFADNPYIRTSPFGSSQFGWNNRNQFGQMPAGSQPIAGGSSQYNFDDPRVNR